MNAGELIRYHRRRKGLTQDDLAAKLNVSKAYISSIENDKKAMSFKQILKFASILEIPTSQIEQIRKTRTGNRKTDYDEFDDLLRAKENLERFLQDRGLTTNQEDIATVPVVGQVPAGTPLATYEDAVDLAESMFPVPSTEVRHGRCFFLKVFGDSMTGIGINEGDLVLIDPEDRELSGIGRVMAIEVDSEVTLKTVLRLDDRHLRLVPENDRYAPYMVDMKKQNVRVIGAVLPFMARWNPNLK